MKLNELLYEVFETRTEFFDRTYWSVPNKKVLVYINKQQFNDPNAKFETWSLDKARRYLETLEPEDEIVVIPTLNRDEKPVSETVQITEENDDGTSTVQWVNSWNGMVEHELIVGD